DIFWINQELTKGVKDFRRFKLFTYEASYYATLFIPVFFFYLLQFLFRQNRIRKIWLLPMLFLPLILSFSIGVLASALLAWMITSIFYFRSLLSKKRILNLFVNLGVLIASTLVVLVLWFRHNPLFTRVANIFSGADTSAKGRTRDA